MNYENQGEKRSDTAKEMKATVEETKPESAEKINYIVRVVDTDVNGQKNIYNAVRKIKGINHRFGLAVARIFENNSKISMETKIGFLSDEKVKSLEDIIRNPAKYNIPAWFFNTRKEYETKENLHLTANELEFAKMNTIKRLRKTKSYKGTRHSFGLKVRGQRTRSTGRKGTTVGVQKKDVKK